MHQELLDRLCCPDCQGPLELMESASEGQATIPARIAEGVLWCDRCSAEYPITGGIPRFVPPSNYADNFGLQWNRFRQTQLDSHSGHPISEERFYRQSGWKADDLRDHWVLDVGCGAGRFTEVALASGAHVVSMDYSTAVDACLANHGHNPRLNVVQGDIFQMPFAPGRFDFVYCFGVLQHTPDPERAFRQLPLQVAPGGQLAIDCYAGVALNVLWPKYWLRPFTKRMDTQRLFGIVQKMTPALLKISRAVGRTPLVGRRLRYAVPVVNYEGILPLSDEQLRIWAILDTFDMLSPAHDHPRSVNTVRRWLQEAGIENAESFRDGQVIGRGRRPQTADAHTARAA